MDCFILQLEKQTKSSILTRKVGKYLSLSYLCLSFNQKKLLRKRLIIFLLVTDYLCQIILKLFYSKSSIMFVLLVNYVKYVLYNNAVLLVELIKFHCILQQHSFVFAKKIAIIFIWTFCFSLCSESISI